MNDEYGKLNGVPIDADPSMPDGQKRWEIVPWAYMVRKGDECTPDGKNWFDVDPKCVDWAPIEMQDNFSHILAFRRPITQPVAKATNPASLEHGAEFTEAQLTEVASELMGVSQETYKYVDERTTEVMHEAAIVHLRAIAHLRTLATAQANALEAAEKALRGLFDGVNEALFPRHKGFPIPDCIKRMADAQHALTLIQQAREVGK